VLEPRRSVFGGSLDQSGQKLVARGMSEREPPSTVIAINLGLHTVPWMGNSAPPEPGLPP
jgi:hypothetical protein